MNRTIFDLPTPALLIDLDALEHNVHAMGQVRPGTSLRPHVKAHKSTRLAGLQAAAGHVALCCSTLQEVVGLCAAGLGTDLLLANEVLDVSRLAGLDGRITLAVDSEETISAAAAGGLREVVIDVDVGLRRCGCAPTSAGRLADFARAKGVSVRGVMGYEGPCSGVENRAAYVEQAMTILLAASQQVGGDVVSAGGTATYDVNPWASELQAGTYLLMDAAHSSFGSPFRCALSVLCAVISESGRGWIVCDAGIKAMEVSLGLPTVEGASVLGLSDEHIVLSPHEEDAWKIGDRVRLVPGDAPVTMSRHSQAYLIRGDDVQEVCPIDLRGW